MNPAIFAGGVTVAWKVSPFYTRKNDLRNLDVKRMMIDSERETFLFNTRLQDEQSQSVVNDLKEKIKQDERIIQLRENIVKASEKKVQNGIETINEMLRDVNAVNQARQQKAIHEIELLQEIYKLRNINNN